ncbi:hypothetical protein GQ457_09G016300 [Hibiscus cannabinus]
MRKGVCVSQSIWAFLRPLSLYIFTSFFFFLFSIPLACVASEQNHRFSSGSTNCGNFPKWSLIRVPIRVEMGSSSHILVVGWKNTIEVQIVLDHFCFKENRLLTWVTFDLRVIKGLGGLLELFELLRAFVFRFLNYCEMSRCFPFPPPGYEKKARTDDVDFLKKEKQKEKKHKKDKDKEKRENKEKKEKDRSDGKHKDKKDKKEKHKDKKKDKDRDKEKDRSNNTEAKIFPGHPERQNGEKTADEKKLPGKSDGHSGEKLIPKEKGNDKDRSSFSSEKKLGGHFLGNNGEKVIQNSRLDEEFRDAKFVQELGRRVRDEGARAGNRLVEKFMRTEPERDEGMVRLVAKTATAFNEEKAKNKRSDDRKLDVQGIRDERRPGGNVMVQNIAGVVKTRVEGVPRQLESNTERQDEWKEKTKEKGSDDKIRDRCKDKDREKKGHGKDKDRDKEEKKKKKKEEKAKAKGEHRNLESDNLKGSNKDVPVGTNSLKASDSSKEGNKGGVIEENHRKRKDCEKNGFFHVNDVKPSKLPKTTSSLLTDNGKTLEPCEAPIPLASDSHRAGTGLKVDAKENKLNGTNKAQLSYISPTKHLSATVSPTKHLSATVSPTKLSSATVSPTKLSSATVSPTKHLSASAQANQIDAVSLRPPHPDSKYLSQVLSVPEMEEWFDFDEQSWLFHSNEYQSKKPKVGFSDIDESPQVWAEALQIESADVCALPYVIPY